MKQNTRKIITNVIIFALLLLAYFGIYYFVNHQTNSYLTGEWGITESSISSTTTYVSSLSEANFDLKEAEMVILTTTLPEMDIEHPMIKLYFYNCAFIVQVDGQTIYESGQNEINNNEMVPNGAFFISLPDDFQGKQLKIYFTPIMNNAFSSLPNVAIGQESNLLKNYYRSDVVQIAIGFFLFIMGFLLLITMFLHMKDSFISIKLLFISSVSILSACWLFVSAGLLRTLFGQIPYMSELEYLLLYATPIIIIIYIMDKQTKPLFRLLCKIQTAVFSLFVIASIVFNTLHILNYAQLLLIFHILVAIVLIFLLWFTIYNCVVNKDESEGIFLRGLAIMIVLLLFDIVKFNFSKFLTTQATDTNDIIVPISILILVFSMIQSSIKGIVKTIQSNIESQVKEKFNYTDGLTGVSSRNKCVDYLDAKSDHAAVTCFDIKGLKNINRIYGHAHGDVYLTSFSYCLTNVFKNANLIGRIGDDEFVVVENDVTRDTLKEEIKLLSDMVKVAVVDEENPLDFHYGSILSENTVLWKSYEQAAKILADSREV